MAAVQQDWGVLRYASATLQNDKEVVMAAVQQNGYAETCLPLKNDKEFVIARVQENGRHWYMPLPLCRTTRSLSWRRNSTGIYCDTPLPL